MSKPKIGVTSYNDREEEARALAADILSCQDARELLYVLDRLASHIRLARDAHVWMPGAPCCADRPESEGCSHVTGEFDAMLENPSLEGLAMKLRHSYSLLDASLHLLHTAGEELEQLAGQVPPQGSPPRTSRPTA